MTELPSVEAWELILRSFFRHYLKRYGAEELATWKVEVYFGGYQIRGLDPLESYLQILGTTVRVVKTLIPEIEVGGPGFFPGMGREEDERIHTFWKTIVSKQIPLDFVSVMSYPYEIGEETSQEAEGGYASVSSDPAYLLHNIEYLERVLCDIGLAGSRLYITEWNMSVSDRNYMNDACYRGCNLIRNIIDTIQRVDMIGIMSGSDRISEYYDSKQLLHGGNGLITKDDIFKPVAYAVEFLNKLCPYLIGKGENYIATTDRKRRYRVLCHNMRPLSYYYYLTGEGSIEKDKLDRCFADWDPVTIEFGFRDLEDGAYLLRLHRV